MWVVSVVLETTDLLTNGLAGSCLRTSTSNSANVPSGSCRLRNQEIKKAGIFLLNRNIFQGNLVIFHTLFH